jgi:hypothetical protein
MLTNGISTWVTDKPCVEFRLVKGNGFDHLLTTRLHRGPSVAAVLMAATDKDAVFVSVGDDGIKATEVVVIGSPHRQVGDNKHV